MTLRYESLDPETWRRIDQILDRVFDADAADRGSILEEECGDDGALRRQVESLLAAESRTGLLDSDLSDEPSLFARALEDARGDAEGDLTMTSSERRFGPYRVVRMLGAGGMGVVYEGWDTRLERPVAIKVLPQGVARGSGSADAEERFLREARAASALDHANICSIYDIGVAEEGTLDEGRTFLVMALYRGETLRERMERGPLDLDEAVDLARQIARGLARAHEAGIVHRDVKPANVFVTEHGEAKILDFGLAKMIDQAGLTRTGEVLGTPAYMSPEQLLGQEVDARADVWAFGVLLYRMVGGARPFPTGSAASLNAVLSRDPEPLAVHRPETPPELARLVERCLAKDPERRPQRMREILGVLGDAPTATTRWTKASHAESASSKRRLLWAAAALVALVLVGVAWRMWNADSTSDTETTNSQSSDSSAVASANDAGASETEPTGLVVLPFHGLNPDPDVAGLGRVITEMLVTDLRGSPDLAVASTSRLHRALEAVGWSDDEPPSPRAMRRLADEVGRDTVLHGSYTRLGDRYRILATLERVSGGRRTDEQVLMSKQVESTEAGLFNAVDELSLAVREALRARSVGRGGVAAVTTNSLEAMAAYSKGIVFFYDRRYEDAIAAFREAVKLDPTFALAWRRLGLTLDNIGNRGEAETCLERAYELADRLPPKLRIPIRADHYASSWSTLNESIEVYEQGLDLYPNETAWHNNLGYSYALIERYGEAETHFERAISLGTQFGYAWVNLGLILAAQGLSEKGVEKVESFVSTRPDEWAWQNALAWQLALSGRLDDALEILEKAAKLVPHTEAAIEANRWGILALKEDWHWVSSSSSALVEAGDEEGKRALQLHEARSFLFHGKSQDALGSLQETLDASSWTSLIQQDLRAQVLLERGENAAALSLAVDLQRESPGGWFERRGIVLESLARDSLGDADGALKGLQALVDLDDNPTRVDLRQRNFLAGRLALSRGDTSGAVTHLTKAADLLPPRGIQFGMAQPQHVAIWYTLGQAQLANGDEEAARLSFERVVQSQSERLSNPISWARGLFWLGELEFRLGEPNDGQKHLYRFVSYRSDADLDQNLVEIARDRLAGSRD